MNARKVGAGAVLALVVLALLVTTAAFDKPEPSEAKAIPGDPPDDAGSALWETRGVDVIFQMAIILAGAFGVLVLVRGVTGRD